MYTYMLLYYVKLFWYTILMQWQCFLLCFMIDWIWCYPKLDAWYNNQIYIYIWYIQPAMPIVTDVRVPRYLVELFNSSRPACQHALNGTCSHRNCKKRHTPERFFNTHIPHMSFEHDKSGQFCVSIRISWPKFWAAFFEAHDAGIRFLKLHQI